MKMKTAALALLIACGSTSAFASHDRNSLRPDSQRERIGLQTVSTQLGKINELATAAQGSANTRGKAQFNYAKFQNEILKLQKQVDDFLYRPLQPVPVSVLDNGGAQFRQ